MAGCLASWERYCESAAAGTGGSPAERQSAENEWAAV